ncbi:TSUP family transporter [Cryptosporangium sp. NPDC051539]|uniref:TSUP family transporter n=1 Tax=Cryptosporangium sp. NPDC051539 TaxID=3363962 RepID=UPI0037B671F3
MESWALALAGFGAGLLIAIVTTPVGVSGAVFLLPGATVFRLVAAGVLMPLGVWLCLRTVRPARPGTAPVRRVALLAFGVGVVGGIYGIGGGSIMGPILVGRGRPVSVVAPAALASTFAASVCGALVYAGLALVTSVSAAPDWTLGLLAGAGGLLGGYAGARLQPRLPETGLRLLLGGTAAPVGVRYALESL